MIPSVFNNSLIIALILPILLVSLIFSKFIFYQNILPHLRSPFVRYFLVGLLFATHEYLILEITFDSLGLFCYQYVLPISTFFMRRFKHWRITFSLLPFIQCLFFYYHHFLSLELLAKAILGDIVVFLACYCITYFKGRTNYQNSVYVVVTTNLLMPIWFSLPWISKVVPFQRYTFARACLVLIGTLFIVIVINFYVKEYEHRQYDLKRLEFDRLHDSLTGLLNYRAFSDFLTQPDFSQQQNLQFIMFDLDHFKQLNDHYGHLVGNDILSYFSRQLMHHLSHDFAPGNLRLYRFGGEEFCAVVANASTLDCYNSLVKLRQSLVEEPFLITSQATISLTFSAGISSMKKAKDYSETIALADAALYLAKNNGRNQIVVQ